MYERRNSVIHRTGVVLDAQTSNPIVSGEMGLWFDGTTTFLVKKDGTVAVMNSAPNAYKDVCRLATATAVLPNTPTYNGTALTLTAGSNSTLTVDSTVAALGDRILVKDQATATQNGIYTLTTLGGAVPWVLTRAPDCNTSSLFETGFLVAVSAGTVNADTFFMFTTNPPFVMDTNNATFAAAPLSITYGLVGAMAASGTASANSAGVAAAVARIDHAHATASVNLTNTTNQLTLGAAGHVAVISSTAPAGASNTLTISDTAGADTFAMVTLAQTLAGKTLTTPVIASGLTATGAGAVDYSGSTATFLTPTGASTFGGSTNSFTNAITVAATTNQLTLGAAAHVAIITSTAPAGASNTLTIPDTAGADTFVFRTLAQTLAGKTLTTPVIATGLTATGAGTVDFSGATSAFKMPTGTLTYSGPVNATATALQTADPGNAGAIAVVNDGVCAITTVGVETRTLADPTFIGQTLTLAMNVNGGNCVITTASAFDSAAHTHITMSAVGQTINLIAVLVSAARKWRLQYNDGTALS